MDNNNQPTKGQQFIKELHDLLAKYNAEISIGLDGDTHGLDSWLEVNLRLDPTKFKYETILKVSELSQYDLKEFLIE